MVCGGDSECENDDDVLEEMGFMFDSALPKSRRIFHFGNDMTVAVRLVDDDPGAVQSGHYVWPAAPALCSYLISRWPQLPHGTVLELGAGCGLAGLVAAQLPGTRVVIFTDHDAGVLDLIRESIAEQSGGSSPAALDRRIAKKAVAAAACARLPWGPVGKAEHTALTDALTSVGIKSPPPLSGETKLGNARDDESGTTVTEALRKTNVSCSASFDLVIASDVIYSISVVEPLFETVGALLLLPAAAAAVGPDEALLSRGDWRNEGEVVARSGNKMHHYHHHRDGKEQGQPSAPLTSLSLGGSSSSPGGGTSSDDTVVDDMLAGMDYTDSLLPSPPPPPPPPRTSTQGGCNNHLPHTPPLPPPGDSGNSRPTAAATEHCCRRYFPVSTCTNAAVAVTPAPVFVMSQSFVYEPETEEAIARACERHGLLREVVWDELQGGSGGNGAEGLEEASRLKSGGEGNDVAGDHCADGGTRNSTSGDTIRPQSRIGTVAREEREEERGARHENDSADHLAGGGDDGGAESVVQRAGTKLQLFWRA